MIKNWNVDNSENRLEVIVRKGEDLNVYKRRNEFYCELHGAKK